MHCTLCPHRCGACRTEEKGSGLCRMPSRPMLARAALHHWEEPPISGSHGSGAIFFSGCPLQCVFCQNELISRHGFGKPVSVLRLREICLELAAAGAHNINLVNPTHFAHAVAELLEEPLPVPVVWNSGGYDRVETLRTLEGRIDIYLPDLKYLDSAAAARWSGAADYPTAAAGAIEEMVRQTGPCTLNSAGLLQRGTVIRHLQLPGRLEEAKAVMDWVAARFAPGEVLFSLMSQYLPWGRAKEDRELGRRLRPSEARRAREYMKDLGLEGFVQEDSASQADYIPPFDLTGV